MAYQQIWLINIIKEKAIIKEEEESGVMAAVSVASLAKKESWYVNIIENINGNTIAAWKA